MSPRDWISRRRSFCRVAGCLERLSLSSIPGTRRKQKKNLHGFCKLPMVVALTASFKNSQVESRGLPTWLRLVGAVAV